MNRRSHFDSDRQCHLFIFRPCLARSLKPDHTVRFLFLIGLQSLLFTQQYDMTEVTGTPDTQKTVHISLHN